MVPGSASSGLVAPISLRADFTTPSPSHTCPQGGAGKRVLLGTGKALALASNAQDTRAEPPVGPRRGGATACAAQGRAAAHRSAGRPQGCSAAYVPASLGDPQAASQPGRASNLTMHTTGPDRMYSTSAGKKGLLDRSL